MRSVISDPVPNSRLPPETPPLSAAHRRARERAARGPRQAAHILLCDHHGVKLRNGNTLFRMCRSEPGPRERHPIGASRPYRFQWRRWSTDHCHAREITVGRYRAALAGHLLEVAGTDDPCRLAVLRRRLIRGADAQPDHRRKLDRSRTFARHMGCASALAAPSSRISVTAACRWWIGPYNAVGLWVSGLWPSVIRSPAACDRQRRLPICQLRLRFTVCQDPDSKPFVQAACAANLRARSRRGRGPQLDAVQGAGILVVDGLLVGVRGRSFSNPRPSSSYSMESSRCDSDS